jgi:hypothetical protein
MKLKIFTKEKSSRFIVEKHKPIIPTIIYWNEKIGNHQLITFKFSFWKWWYKIGFMFVS